MSSKVQADFLVGGGKMGELIRAKDWSETPLGPVDVWPQSLRSAVSICLGSKFPILIWWGPDLLMLYNDGYRPILGATKHPQALGQPGRECWPEIWHIIGPMLEETVMRQGEATWSDDQLLLLDRNGYLEECYFTFSYSPIRDESGGVGGVFCAVTETTARVIGERRLRTLRELAAQVAQATTAEDACREAAATLAVHNTADVLFALLYLLSKDGRQAQLAGCCGIAPGTPASPQRITFASDGLPDESRATGAVEDGTENRSGWPLAQVAQMGQGLLVGDLDTRFGSLPGGHWPDPPHTALVMPIAAPSGPALAGLLVVGLSPRLAFDDDYRGFLDLLARQVATAIANARAYEEEKRRAEALAELDRAKTTFFSNVSHEFRTPLTLLLGPLEESLAAARDPAERERLEMIYHNALRLQKLVNTLLDFARIEAGRLQASYIPTDLAALTSGLASVFRSAIEKAGLRLIVDCPPLPEPVYVDREMWEKVVLNLLSNAFKFTLAGQIEVVLRDAGDSVQLTVRDTGSGIDVKHLPHIFARFHRIENSYARTQEGTGIGLALVQELVKLHGGAITVESSLGQGSAFTVTLPKGKAHLPPDQIVAPDAGASTVHHASHYVEEALRWLPEEVSGETGETIPFTNGPTGRARILIADDNTDMRSYIRRLLGGQYQVETVADGEAALAAVRRNPPDLLLADVMMPRLDGFGLLKAIRSDPGLKTLPVILLSARAGEEAKVEGLEAGADDYLIKPFSARELLARVGAHLALAQARRASEAQWQALFGEAPLGVYLIDADFRISRANRTARLHFGDLPDLIGRDFAEVAHMFWSKEYADEVVRRFHHTLTTGRPYIAPERVEQRPGSGVIEYYEWRISRILLPDGRYGVVCYFRDVSSQVLARQAIAESEERYRGIVNQSIGGIAETDPTGRFTTVNDRYCQITGYSRMELLRLRMQDITHPEDLPRNLALFEQVAAGASNAFEIEKRYVRKDGAVVWVHNSVSALRDATGMLRSLIAISIDITERKEAEEALRRLNETLEERVAERTEQVRSLVTQLTMTEQEERRRISQILHDDLQQRLYAIQFHLHTLRREFDPDRQDHALRALAEIEEELQSSVQITRSLSIDLSPPILHDEGLAKAVAWLAVHMQRQHGLSVTVQAEDGLPRLHEDLRVMLFQVVRELLFNIVKHARVSSAAIYLAYEDGRLRIEVRDQGRGFDPSAVMEHEQQSHGLLQIRRRLQLVGGYMEVESAVGKGTCITLYSPLLSGAA